MDKFKSVETSTKDITGGGTPYDCYFNWYRSYVKWFYTPSQENEQAMASAHYNYANGGC